VNVFLFDSREEDGCTSRGNRRGMRRGRRGLRRGYRKRKKRTMKRKKKRKLEEDYQTKGMSLVALMEGTSLTFC
jgi:hypothetical protein